MGYDKKCKYCGALTEEIKKSEVAGTIYHYLKCPKCKKEIARREE